MKEVVMKLATLSKEVRLTEHSVGVLKGNIRGGWVDNDDVFTFYPNKTLSLEWIGELAQRLPSDIKIGHGYIDFPKKYV